MDFLLQDAAYERAQFLDRQAGDVYARQGKGSSLKIAVGPYSSSLALLDEQSVSAEAHHELSYAAAASE